MNAAAAIAWLVAAAAALQPCEQRPRSETGEAFTADEIECLSDAQCALAPIVTCCGECPAEPPYEAITLAELDAIFIEAEERCALDRRECTPPVCAPPPACEARAACDAGECVAVPLVCGWPTS